MPKVSVMILTQNRAELLSKALLSVQAQTFRDHELIVVNDGSTDGTQDVIRTFKHLNIKIIEHQASVGITASRQEALLASSGSYVAILDDDDEWVDPDKLKKQVEFLDQHPDVVLVGGGIKISNIKHQISKIRPQTDRQIRKTMLFRNNFFTSTVMFRRGVAIKAGGFIKDQDDFAEDYDLWLRMGKLGKMHNFQEIFTLYHQPDYNKERFKAFLQKQRILIKQHRRDYPHPGWAEIILKFRLLFNSRP